LANLVQWHTPCRTLRSAAVNLQHQIPPGPVRTGTTDVQPVSSIRDLGVYSVSLAQTVSALVFSYACISVLFLLSMSAFVSCSSFIFTFVYTVNMDTEANDESTVDRA